MSDVEEEVGPSSCSLLAGCVFSISDTPRVFDSMRMVLITGRGLFSKMLTHFALQSKKTRCGLADHPCRHLRSGCNAGSECPASQGRCCFLAKQTLGQLDHLQAGSGLSFVGV